MRLLPLALVGLLVTATVGVGAVVPAPVAEPEPSGPAQPTPLQVSTTDQSTTELAGTPTNVLAIPGPLVERSDLRRHHVDLGPAAGFDTAAATDSIATSVIDRELAAGSEAEQRQRLEHEVAALESTVTRLRQREAAAISAFADGDREPKALLEELALIGGTVTRLQERHDVLEARANTLEVDSSLSDRLTAIDYELRMLDGPVRSYAEAVLSGDRSDGRVSIQATDESIELTAIDGDEYLREVYRMENRRGGGEITAGDVETFAEEQYPVWWEQRSGGTWSIAGPGPISVLSINGIGLGSLQLFIDGGTGQPFVEHQRLSLDEFVASQQTTKVQDGLEVRVQRSYIGGPLGVTVLDAETGESVDATIRLGQNGQESQEIGMTTGSAPVWTLTPRGEFTLTVISEDDSAAFVEITPQEATEAV